MPTVSNPPILLRKEEVMRRIGLRPTQLRKLMKAGDFPQSVQIVPGRGRAVGWLESEVSDWIARRVASRGQPAE